METLKSVKIAVRGAQRHKGLHPCGSFLNWGDGSVREELDKHELDRSTHVNRLDVVACSFTPAPGRWRHRSPQESLVIQPRRISDL